MERETGRMISVMGSGVIALVVGCVLLVAVTQWASTANAAPQSSARESETPPGIGTPERAVVLGIGGALRGGQVLSLGFAGVNGEIGVALIDRPEYDAAIGYAVAALGNWRLGLGWADRLTPLLGSRLNFAIGYNWQSDSRVSLRWLHFSNGSRFISTPDTEDHPNIGEDVIAVTIRF